MEVGIVIVDYNSGDDLPKCLKSISKSRGKISSVVIVANGSEVPAKDALPAAMTDITIIDNENVGFGRACNIGAKKLPDQTEVYLFLNPDVRLLPETIPSAVDIMRENPSVGVVGPQNRVPGSNEIRRTCARSPTLIRMLAQYHGLPRFLPGVGIRMNDWDHTETQYVDHVMGGCYLIRADVFEEVDGFDDDYFVFYEDIDLSIRVRAADYQVIYSASSSAIHPPGPGVTPLRLGHSINGRLIFANKHFNVFEYTLLLVSMLTTELTFRLFHAALGDTMDGPMSVIQGYILAFKLLRTK